MKKSYEPSRQWSIRLDVYMNDHLIKSGNTDLFYYTGNNLKRKRIAKRIAMINTGKIKIDGFWDS